MDKLKKLPDAEFEVMKTIWANEPPVTTNLLMEQLGNKKTGSCKRWLHCCSAWLTGDLFVLKRMAKNVPIILWLIRNAISNLKPAASLTDFTTIPS